jgi:hypothetical protein
MNLWGDRADVTPIVVCYVTSIEGMLFVELVINYFSHLCKTSWLYDLSFH